MNTDVATGFEWFDQRQAGEVLGITPARFKQLAAQLGIQEKPVVLLRKNRLTRGYEHRYISADDFDKYRALMGHEWQVIKRCELFDPADVNRIAARIRKS